MAAFTFSCSFTSIVFRDARTGRMSGKVFFKKIFCFHLYSRLLGAKLIMYMSERGAAFALGGQGGVLNWAVCLGRLRCCSYSIYFF